MDENRDKKIQTALLKNLEKLGLTDKEARVYVYLVGRTAEVGTSKIVAATRLHGQYIYNALESLEEKGLVRHVVKNNRNKWSANPPARISFLIEEKRMLAHSIEGTLEKLFVRRIEQDFEVFQGEDQFVTNELAMMRDIEPQSSLCIIGGEGSRFSKLLGNSRRLYNEMSVEKEVSVRYIGSSDQQAFLENVRDSRPFFEYRIMPNFQKSSVSTSIYPDTILFQIYGDPLLVFKIRNKRVAQEYQQFFDALWKLCPSRP